MRYIFIKASVTETLSDYVVLGCDRFESRVTRVKRL